MEAAISGLLDGQALRRDCFLETSVAIVYLCEHCSNTVVGYSLSDLTDLALRVLLPCSLELTGIVLIAPTQLLWCLVNFLPASDVKFPFLLLLKK